MCQATHGASAAGGVGVCVCGGGGGIHGGVELELVAGMLCVQLLSE
jgi:hypothetical protein